MIFTLDSDMRKALMVRRKTGLKKGMWAGWRELYDLYTVKRGSTTYIVAPPTVGKTAFIYEITMNLAEYENCKVCIFTPETGSPLDVYNELLWAYLRQPFLKHEQGTATQAQIKKALDFISEHFFILDPMHADLDENMYFEGIRDLQEKKNIKIDIAVIDPITDMDIDGAARDLALGKFLTRVRKFSSSYDIHTIVAFHTRAMGMIEGKDVFGKKRRYYPPPTMGDVAGGEMASRKGMFIIGLWRPPYQVIDPETGEQYIPNETRVEILKAKPKAVGKRGIVNIYYDVYSSRYYMMKENGKEKITEWSYPKPQDIE